MRPRRNGWFWNLESTLPCLAEGVNRHDLMMTVSNCEIRLNPGCKPGRPRISSGRMTPPLSLTHHLRHTLSLALVVMLAVDTILVGQAGGHELAFFAISAAPQIIMLATSVGLLVGAVVLTAQADGAGRLTECGRFWRLAMLLAVGLGLFFSAILLRGDLLLHWLGEDDGIARGGGQVMRMWAIGMPAAILYMATGSFLEGISRTRAAMVVSLASNLVNFPLAWALVFGH